MLVWFAQNLKLVVSWGCCKFAAKLNQNQHPWCCENAFAKQHDLGVVVTPAPLNDSIGRCDGAIKKKNNFMRCGDALQNSVSFGSAWGGCV